MKKISILILILLSIRLQAQNPKVTILGTKKAEVGKDYTFTAKVTGTDSTITIQKYQWSVSLNGSGYGGASNIKGYNSKTTIKTSDTISTFNVIWGDGKEDCYWKEDKIGVSVFYLKDTIEKQIPIKEKKVEIMFLEIPTITPNTSIQRCCTDTIRYCAEACTGNYFSWIITGGTPSSQEGAKKCITVTPSANKNIEIKVRARRKDGLTKYYRDVKQTIKRTEPKTPSINGLKDLCKGQTYEFCVNQFCGMTGINWIIPSSLVILSGQGTKCVKVTPSSAAEDGVSFNIIAVAIMEGDCIAADSKKNVTIYSSEIPPEPVGYVILEDLFPGDIDPCDEANFYSVKFVTTKQYKNGYTIILPKTVIDVPHHNLDDRIEVTVCNYNICSGIKKCKTFIVYLPDCPPDDDDKWSRLVISNNNSEKDNLSSIIKYNDILFRSEEPDIFNDKIIKVNIFPNPFSGFTNMIFPFVEYGTIQVFDITGKSVYNEQIQNTNHKTIILEDKFKDGTYFVRLISEQFSVVKKLIHHK